MIQQRVFLAISNKLTQDDAVIAIQAQVDEQAFSKGLIAANLQVASERIANLDTWASSRSQKSDFQISASQTSLAGRREYPVTRVRFRSCKFSS